jgi:hypothetical protein
MSETTTEPDATPVENHPCAQCGQLDDHPTVHVLGPWQKDETTILVHPSFHYDCLPADADVLWGLDLTAPEHAVTAAAAEAAAAGVHGDELRAFIASLPSDNDVEPVPAEES